MLRPAEMKRLELLILERDVRAVTEGLGRLGVVHFSEAAAAGGGLVQATHLENQLGRIHSLLERVATLWEAVMGYRAMRLNERHDFAGAAELYQGSSDQYDMLVSSLPDSAARSRRYSSAQQRVSSRWDGRSKRQAYSLSKKAMLQERDLRRKDQGDWTDHLDDDRS